MNNMGSIQTSAMYKGNYIMPKTLEMGEIVSNSSASMNNNLTMHRSTQLNTSNPLANPQNTNASSLYNSNEAHTHIMNTNVNINTITKSYNMPVQLPITSYNQSTNGNSTNKIRNFEQVASQASMQILSFSPNHHKVTYQNLLANLCNNNVSSVSKNISSHNKHILTTNSNKQQFIKLKPIKKY